MLSEDTKSPGSETKDFVMYIITAGSMSFMFTLVSHVPPNKCHRGDMKQPRSSLSA